ncbi:MAG: MinD/ParA family protein [Moorea sp. SIO3G5]|nr:MinD/ParA family protein [Moorena sp. SIO3G5]
MSIIAIHSYRGGAGKTNITASLATIVASQGYRVGIVDADLHNPGIYVLFGLTKDHLGYCLNDYLWNRCQITEADYDVTSVLGLQDRSQITETDYDVIAKKKKSTENCFLALVPASMKQEDISRMLREGYDVRLLEKGFRALINELNLDFLFVDTHPGLNEEVLISLTLSDTLVLIMKPDQQDFQATGILLDLANKLNIQKTLLVMNMMIESLWIDRFSHKVKEDYGFPLAAVIPWSEDMKMLGSRKIFSLAFPEHPLTEVLEKLAHKIIN